ncbi:sedoheptulose-1,7-bisphosphatase [Nemania serpens]|nr:sedoheptulose-1,7-bisphosphatase [Nemania serpens]
MTSQSSADLLTASLRRAMGDAHPSLTTSVLPALLRGISRTATALRSAHSVEKAGSENVFGDAQLNVDVQAELFFREEIRACAAIVAASSEEDPVEVRTAADSDGNGDGNEIGSGSADENPDVYAVAFDPLDGSSIIGPNWAVGSIIGIWAGATALGRDPRDQVAAVLGVYGPRTTALIAVRIPGREASAVCVEVGISADSHDTYALVREDVRLDDRAAAAAAAGEEESSRTRYFAPANLRAAAEDERYMGLVTRYIAERYTLRYSGGLVPDVAHALEKGHGVYVSPVTRGSQAKLRRAFELLPVALVVECAGGRAVDPGDGRRVLETPLRTLDERGGLVCGCREEVERVREWFGVGG